MRFPDLPSSAAYIVGQWPRAIRTLESVPFRAGYDGEALLAICHWAGLSGPAGLRRSGFGYRGVSALAGLAAMDRHGAGYHHSGHIAHVVMAAGILATADGLSQLDRDVLIVAALAHDLDHQGCRRNRQIYRTERRSAKLAIARLFRDGCDHRIAERLHDLLLATSFADDGLRDDILACDPIAAYLIDADLFASTFYRRAVANALTGHIKHEDRLGEPRDDLVSTFVEVASKRGFYTAIAKELHAVLPVGYSVLNGADEPDA